MPSNFKTIKYVLGFDNSDYLFADLQYHLWDSPRNAYCSKYHYWQYETLHEVKEALLLFKNKAKNSPNFCFFSIDECFPLDENIDNFYIEFYIEEPNYDEGSAGCKWPKLSFSIDDLKIFSREVEVTYKEIVKT